MSVLFTGLRGGTDITPRLRTGLEQVDRVSGGGYVPGSTTLFSGDPGAGKSTLLLQVAAAVADPPWMVSVAYVTAEETAEQVQARAMRLGVADSPVRLAATTNTTAAIHALRDRWCLPPRLVVFDSIQTLRHPTTAGDPGSPRQTKAVLELIVRFAHDTGAATIVVCHVTKGGRAAGPNTLQHEVDVVMHLEVLASCRALKASKNRFGPTDEVGLFAMGERGMRQLG